MKKCLVGGLVLTTMFTGVACGGKEDVKEEVSKPEQTVQVQDNNKEDSKPTEDKKEDVKEEVQQIVNNSDKVLDEKLALVSSLLEKENLNEAKKVFNKINLEGVSEAGNKKYADMKTKIKALEEKLNAKKEEEEKKEELKKERESILSGQKFIHIEYDNDKYDSYKIKKLENGNLDVDLKSDMIDLSGTLSKKSDNSWTGTLYNSQAGIDSFYDFVITNDAIKIIQSNDSNVRTLTLYLKSKTYKEENTNPNAIREMKGNFTLR